MESSNNYFFYFPRSPPRTPSQQRPAGRASVISPTEPSTEDSIEMILLALYNICVVVLLETISLLTHQRRSQETVGGKKSKSKTLHRSKMDNAGADRTIRSRPPTSAVAANSVTTENISLATKSAKKVQDVRELQGGNSDRSTGAASSNSKLCTVSSRYEKSLKWSHEISWTNCSLKTDASSRLRTAASIAP